MQTKTKSALEVVAEYWADRRHSHRENVFTIGRITRLDNDTVFSHEVMITDVSLHGCGFRSAVELDETLPYHMSIGIGPLHLSAKIRIIRVRLRSDGSYDIGSQFC